MVTVTSRADIQVPNAAPKVPDGIHKPEAFASFHKEALVEKCGLDVGCVEFGRECLIAVFEISLKSSRVISSYEP